MTKRRPFPWRVFSRLLVIQTGLSLLALLISGVAARHFFKEQSLSALERQLQGTLVGLSHFLRSPPGAGWCASTAEGMKLRLTVISVSGAVLCDSAHDAESMDNHVNRPEVRQALSDGFGATVRRSRTQGIDMLYGALKAEPGHLVLRGAIPLSSLSASLRVLDRSLILFLAGVAVFLAFMAIWARRSSYGEWLELEDYLNGIQKELQTKVDTLELERERQATIINSISDALVAVDRDGRILFHNQRLADLCGQADLRRSSYWELFRLPEIVEAFTGAVREGKYITTGAVALRSGDSDRFYSVAVSPLVKGAEVYGAVAVFHDVSELKHAEQMRIDFVANVSHELRTPLTAIKGYSDTLLSDVEAGRGVDPGFLTSITRNSDRLMTLVEDLLDLSSLESSEVLNIEPLSTEEVTNRVLNQLKRVFEKKSHRISTRFEAAQVFADQRRLEQVLINLLDNAAKYTPSAGEIGIVWREQAGASVIEVSDTGPGIPSEHLPRLFERFYRVDKARSRELGGSGLGLAIVKHIMQRHGGSVSVMSTLGKGSVFSCRFPRP
ncbi:MAG: ATP-binding protein [Oligoflexia bacterium]|nr:ATP-binding protein [Oligoflexia bacterium]